MATLVLTAVGSAIGGPLGGVIGAVIGNQADQRLFAPKRQGARLGALTVQTSAYGQPIPKLFGRLRVAGTVIWATDLHEDKRSSGGGKGRPKTTSYSYSASFAVALSGRPIRAVHRIWADGKLLRGVGGDWKSETQFRLHHGDESQTVDPLLAAVEGAGGTPAYRGLAYAVFEDMQLADFGNRIPSLTFEVEADAAPVPLADIATVLSDGATAGRTTAALGGYAAGGASVRGAIEALADVMPLALRDDGERLLLSDGTAEATALSADELGSAIVNARADRRMIDRQAAGTLPDEVTVTYYEPSRDYQTGLQRARRGGPGRRLEAIELPAALEAGVAKAIAERHLADGWAGRSTAVVTLPWRRLDLRPGGIAEVDAQAWRITRWTLEGMVLTLKLRQSVERRAAIPSAQPGRAATDNDHPHGPTHAVLLDLPPLDDGGTTPQLWLAAAGPSSGWRRAAVTMSTDLGASWRDAGATTLPATMGTTLTALMPGEPALFDDVSHVDIDLLNDAMVLVSRDDDALLAGAGLAMVGDELIQFGRAEQLGEQRWRLSRLLRGRRGTEAAIIGHAAGEPFVLIEADALLGIAVPGDAIGGTMQVIVSGIGDPTGVRIDATIGARALRPPTPVHLRAFADDGTLRFEWTRRSRTGWSWTDGGDVPIGEERERYLLRIAPAGGLVRTVDLDTPMFLYTAAMRAADGAAGATAITIDVTQLGTLASSLPAMATFNLRGERL